MASINSFRFLKLNFFSFLSVFPLLITANTLLPSEGDANIEELLSGHVRIRREAVPPEVLPCLTQPDFGGTYECQFKHSQWNNMHCLNNSFGMYGSDNQFVNFGMEPMGIVFPSLFFNPIAYPGSSGHSSDSDEHTKKIEALLEANAEASMNITLLGEMIETLQREKQELEEELNSVKHLNIELQGQMHVFQVQAKRWEEVHNECTESSVAHRNASSITLNAARDHIEQLELQNKVLNDVNTKCSFDLKYTQSVLSDFQQKGEESEAELARCSVNLAAMRESAKAAETALAKEENQRISLINDYQEERTLLMAEIREAQTARSSCEASLRDNRDVYQETKQNYESCLANLGGTNARLQLCRSALDLCHGNHSVATSAGHLCEEDRKLCQNEVDRLTESLSTCKHTTNVLHEDVNTLKENEQKLMEQISSFQSEIETAKQSEKQLNALVADLKTDLQEERNALSDAEAQAHECTLNLVTATTSRQLCEKRAEVVSEKLNELTQKYAVLSRKNYITIAEFSSLQESYTLLKSDNEKCHIMLTDASESAESLVLNEAECHKQLANLTTSLSVIESQRDACYSSHDTSIDQVDEWRVRYEDISIKLTTCSMQNANCSGQLAMMTNLYNSLEEEANEMHILNINLKSRLNSTVESLSSITSSNIKLQQDLSSQKQVNGDLHKQIAHLEAIGVAEKDEHNACLNKLRESDVQITSMESRLSDMASSTSFLQNRFDHCSQHLNDTQASLQEQYDANAEQERTLLSVRTSLQIAVSQHESVLTQIGSLEHNLEVCHSNHTESASEVLNLELQLTQCQKTITEVQTNSLRNNERFEAQYLDCQLSLRRTTESLNETLLSNEDYQSELRQTALELSSSKKSFEACRSQAALLIQRAASVERLIHNLRGDISTLQNRLKITKHEHSHALDQLTLCRETKTRLDLQLFEITEELEDCHNAAHSTSISWSSGCPRADQGVFASTGSGCLMATRSAGSQQAMDTLCREQAGSQLLDRQTVSTSHFHADVSKLLAQGHLPRSPVWLSIDGDRCYELDLENTSDGPLPVKERTCTDELPGLCIAQHLHGISSIDQLGDGSSFISDGDISVKNSSVTFEWSGDSSMFNQTFLDQTFLDNLNF